MNTSCYIGSVREATSVLFTTEFDAAVSISDPCPEARPVNLNSVPLILRLSFDDRVLPREGKRLFSEADANALITFLRPLKPDARVLFHCYAGQSRSTAAALVWLFIHGGATDLADRMLAIRPQALPNRHVAWTCEDVLGLADRPLTDAIDTIEERSEAPLLLLRSVQDD